MPPLVGTMRAAVLGGSRSRLLENLVSSWKTEEASGTRADDLGVNALTDNNTVTQAAGKIGQAAQFTAANSEYLSKTSAVGLAAQGTLSIWFYADSSPAYNARMIEIGDSNDRVGILRNSGQFIRVDAVVGGVLFFSLISPGTVGTSSWHHVVTTWDANGCALYLDGSEVDSETGDRRVTMPAAPAIYLGEFVGGGTFYWDGRLDAPGIWSRALSASDVALLYNNGNGREYPFA